jgi:hypothetical protein
MKKFLIILFLAVSLAANAVTYYVATDGNDSNNGTSTATPWRTWNYAFNRLVAGDILYIRAGTYTTMATTSKGVSVSGKYGTSSNYITVSGYPGEAAPILSCSSLSESGDRDGLYMSGCSYWRISGIEIASVPDNGSGPASVTTIWGCNYMYFTQVKGHDSGNGFRNFECNELYYTNCDSYQNADVTNSGDLANGFWDRVTGGGRIYYTGCRAWNNSDDGWDAFSIDYGAGYIYYTNCWSFYNGSWNGIYGNGAGFKFGASGAAALSGVQRKAVNCLSLSNAGVGGSGIGYDESQDSYSAILIQVLNSVAYNNGEVGFNFGFSGNTDLIANCISYSNNGAYGQNYLSGAQTLTTNSWQVATATDADFQSVDVEQFKATRQSDGSLPIVTAFHLVTGSDMIGVGTNLTSYGVVYDGQGNTWNPVPSLGAYEYNSTPSVPVTSVTVVGTGGATTITTDNGTLQMIETVLPANATIKTVAWSVASGTGSATISAGGLLTAVTDGTVMTRATANNGVYGERQITISNQVTNIPVTSVSVAGTGGATTITTNGGTLQMIETVLPANATNKVVSWSLTNGTGTGSLSALGLLTAISDGTVIVRATATDGSGYYGTRTITISNQVVVVLPARVVKSAGHIVRYKGKVVAIR